MDYILKWLTTTAPETPPSETQTETLSRQRSIIVIDWILFY